MVSMKEARQEIGYPLPEERISLSAAASAQVVKDGSTSL
jgi:hypothetical protein